MSDRDRYRINDCCQVLANPDTNGPQKWVSADDCVWQSPDFYNLRHSLARHIPYTQNNLLKRLFTDILDIKDADWRDFVGQLRHMREHNQRPQDPEDIYRSIFDDVKQDKDGWEDIR